jgi:FAD:protein FMN transferase
MRSVSTHQPLMGTVVELRIDGDASALAIAEAAVIAEMERLEGIFSAFDATSELHRWRSGETDDPSAELRELLGLALSWQRRGWGAYNPAVGVMTEVWKRAEVDGAPPADAELAALAATIQAPRYSITDGRVTRAGDCGVLNFNAIAKGLVADRSAAVGLAVAGIESIMVNAGGDLVHRGLGSITVGIEDPRNPFDNAAPLTALTIHDEGVATSGGGRRGFDVGGRRFSHVIDPRTGRSIDAVLSATVVASDAVTADVVATIASVLTPVEAVRFVDGLDGVGCYIVDAVGTTWPDSTWLSRADDSASR